MKFKYYLRGCGLGILIATIVMIVAVQTRGGVMTDEKALQRASELGMVSPTESSDDEELLDATEVLRQMQSTQSTETAVQTKSGETESESEAETESESEAEPESESESEAESEPEDDTVSFKVKSGEYCWTISENLEEADLVDDASAFRTYVANNGYDEQFHAGTFTLQKGMTYEEIVKILSEES